MTIKPPPNIIKIYQSRTARQDKRRAIAMAKPHDPLECPWPNHCKTCKQSN